MKFNRRIITLLIIPLSIFALLSLWISGLFSGEQLYKEVFLNLGTDVIGILISLIFVDVVIEVNSRLEWRSAERFIRKNIINTVISVINNLDNALGKKATNELLKYKIRSKLHLPQPLKSTTGWGSASVSSPIDPPPNDFTLSAVKFYETCTYTDFETSFTRLSVQKTIDLSRSLEETLNQTNLIIDLYISKLPPAFIQLLLEIQECIFDFNRAFLGAEVERTVEHISVYHKNQASENTKDAQAQELYKQSLIEDFEKTYHIEDVQYPFQSKKTLSKLAYRIIQLSLKLYHLSLNDQI